MTTERARDVVTDVVTGSQTTQTAIGSAPISRPPAGPGREPCVYWRYC
jgi:hypothetical protein